MKKREMAKCQDSDEERETCAIGSGESVVQEVRRTARGGDLRARRARGSAATMKSAVVVEVSEGDGQGARACEDRGCKAKAWIPGGVAADHALHLALRHLFQKQRLSAVFINFQLRMPDKFLDSRISLFQQVARLAASRRFPSIVCLPSASPFLHR